jgi:hypothetical protein
MPLLQWLGRGRPYKARRYDTQVKAETDRETQIYDPRFRFDILTVEYIKRFKLQPQVIPVLNIPLAYNESRKCFEVISAPSLVDARAKGYYYGASLPTLSQPDYYALAIDSRARLIANILGRDVSPAWVHGGEVTAPAAGTALVSKTVSSGKTGYIYGFFISAGEPNDFKINWTYGGGSYSIRIPFSSRGAIHYIDVVPLNEGLGADGGSSITITNVNAGGSGIVYQARILYAEV